MNRLILLFGGSFNPPHLAHRQVVEYLRTLPAFDEVWVVPVFDHPFCKDLAPYPDRIQMCQLMIKGLEGVRVCEIEGELKKSPSYTIDMILALKSRFPDCHFTVVVGSDCKKDLPRWKDSKRLQQEADFLFVPRPGFEASPFADISSTHIRSRVASGQTVSDLVSPPVAEWISTHHLYDKK